MGRDEASESAPEGSESGSRKGKRLIRLARIATFFVVLAANAVGALIVFVLLAVVLPSVPVTDEGSARLVNGAMAGVYLILAVLGGYGFGVRRQSRATRWLPEGRDPTEREQRRTLRVPLSILVLEMVLWLAAAVVFGIVNALVFNIELGVRIAVVVGFGGVTTSAIAYLLTERVQRRIAVRALRNLPPIKLSAPGVGVRFLLTWALGTAAPVLGLVLLGVSALVDEDASADELALTMIVLGCVALSVGLLAILVTVRAVSGPVRGMRRALERVREGDFEAEVRVDDGSDLGQMQAGFNQMAAGLREREELRDLFGRHVGEDVAKAALENGVEMGGEVRDVAVLFVDVEGSTRLAVERPPEEVVELLNDFFTVVVESIDEEGGWVNKFEGDAALAIFGAPADLEGRDERALRAARRIAERLRSEVDGVRAGVGVSAGEAVAGNIGSTARFEYTVIGDPVNEAARLTEAAKDTELGVLARRSMLERAGEEAGRWCESGEIELRGRGEPTEVIALATGAQGAGEGPAAAASGERAEREPNPT